MIMIDINMPDNCDECRFNTEYGFCKAMPDNFCGNTDDRKRPEWCPLKEQDAVKPVLDEQTGRFWLCGKCGSYVGFEDNDPHDPNEFDKFCRECGRPVLWEGR